LGEGGDDAPKRPGEGGGLSRANADRDESALLVVDVGKNILIMNNPDLILRKIILTKNDAITQHKLTSHILRNYSQFLRSELTNASKK
jgi:hypothetical protein